jgi:alkanesulfonate monooxygenase SsuD/methylene tetrahydromethanopterin reductase-like flavin-dependent oxidoreductase (luciferase family)
MEKINFGVFDHIERTSTSGPLHQLYEERLRLIEAYDQAGVWGYHIAQHHATPLGMAPSPNLMLSAAAFRTRNIRLGTLVHLLPFYNPLRLVEELCMLDHMSGGRVEIGVGRGVSPFELAQFRIPFYESRDIYEDALEVLVKGFTSERLTHHGPYFRYENVPMELRPLQQPHPGFWYGATTLDIATYAARRGMNMVSIGPLEMVKQVVAAFREHRHEAIGNPQNVNPHLERPVAGAIRHVCIAETDREAVEVARESYKVFYANIQKLFRDYGTLVQAFQPDFDVFHKVGAAYCGSVSAVRDQIGKFVEESGCDYLVLAFAWGSLTAAQARRSFDLFANKIMPEFMRAPASRR